MLQWIPYPMVRIAGFFAVGVLVGIYFPGVINLSSAIALAIAFSLLFFVVKFVSDENRFPTFTGLLGLGVVFLLGYSRLLLFNELNHDNHFSKITEPIGAYEAVLRSVPEEKANSWKMEVEMVAVKRKSWKSTTGKLLLYVSKANFDRSRWHYGDRILVQGSPQELGAPANPGEFDFRRFLSFRNIGRQQFVQSGEVKLIAPASRKGLIYYSYEARTWSMKKINAFLHGDNERGVATALILGVTEGIDNDLLNAYAASGAMHLLAVSGMHVGIIYAIILFLCKPFSSWKGSSWVIAGISLLVLWAFAFVTGLSPSVLRAVTMFSFIAVARPFGRRTNIYNTLAASAFVLLLFNPYLILSVGFQLSYLAVLGIVYWQRPIYRWMEIENQIGDWIWQITSVSIAAQAATFPLSLLYFHQFPTYFLLSNLFVIPLSTVVLVGGILLFMISFITPLASVVGIILEGLVRILNWIVYQTESLPVSVVNNIFINEGQCWLLFGIFISLILLFESKSIRWLYVSCVFALTFSFLAWQHFFQSVDQREVIVYSISKHQAVEYIDRGKSYVEMDSVLEKDDQKIRFHIQPNRLERGVKTIHSQLPEARNVNGLKLFRFTHKTIAWITNKKVKLPLVLNFDYLVVSNNSLSREEMKKMNNVQLIFDGTNSPRYVNSFRDAAQGNQIHTAQEGAFVLQ
jgi:competence protein ComEC